MVLLQKRVAALSRASLERFVLRARRAAGLRGIANVLVTGNAVLRALNREFRGNNKVTDVLSFPSSAAHRRGKIVFAGDIAISAEFASQNAARYGHSAADEVKILALHGILHLAGFDHERDNGRMARKEAELRQKLGLPASLIERTLTPKAMKPAMSGPHANSTSRGKAAAARRRTA